MHAAVDTIHEIDARHRGIVPKMRKATQNSATFQEHRLEVRFAGTSSFSTNRQGVLDIVKALNSGDASCTVNTSAQGRRACCERTPCDLAREQQSDDAGLVSHALASLW